MKQIVGSLRWEIGAWEIRDRIQSLPSHYKNLINLHIHLEATTKVKQPSALPYRLSLIDCSHVTHLTHLDTVYQSSQFVCHHLSLPLQRDSNPLAVRKRTLNHLVKFNHLTIWPFWLNCWLFLYELSGCGSESCCSHFNFRYCVCFEQGVPSHSRNYRV